MAIVKCKECKAKVSDKSEICLKCGVKFPAGTPPTGTLVIKRDGWLLDRLVSSDVIIKIDGIKFGAVDCGEEFKARLQVGQHELKLELGKHVETQRFRIEAGMKTIIKIDSSDSGIRTTSSKIT